MLLMLETMNNVGIMLRKTHTHTQTNKEKVAWQENYFCKRGTPSPKLGTLTQGDIHSYP